MALESSELPSVGLGGWAEPRKNPFPSNTEHPEPQIQKSGPQCKGFFVWNVRCSGLGGLLIIRAREDSPLPLRMAPSSQSTSWEQ